MVLSIDTIKYENVFPESDFSNMEERNTLSLDKMVVIYAPNGTGKTCLSNAIAENGKPERSFIFSLDGNTAIAEDVFHIIQDQGSRNIIKGNSNEFLLNSDIEREVQLKKNIDDALNTLATTTLNAMLSEKFAIKKSSSKLIDLIQVPQIKAYVKQFSNNQKDRRKITDYESFIRFVNECRQFSHTLTEEEEKRQISLRLYAESEGASKSIIARILELPDTISKPCPTISKYEENNEAIKILTKYPHMQDCIVCDREIIDPTQLRESKTARKEAIISELDPMCKELIQQIIDKVNEHDHFHIKDILIHVISTGNSEALIELKRDITRHIQIFNERLETEMHQCLFGTDIEANFTEYQRIRSRQIDLETNFELMRELISTQMLDKEVTVDRDDNDNIRITLSSRNSVRNVINNADLSLSAGEKNFLSLAFEILRAKAKNKQIVLIDDPLSSFDSIYKNKTIFLILKLLENQKVFVLTHNVDVIRLLDSQKKNCFSMYIMNRTPGENNGFIPLCSEEVKLLLYLNELVAFLRDVGRDHDKHSKIMNKQLFIYSLIPFMRGYANITLKNSIYGDLSKVMHGYETGQVNLTQAYDDLFPDVVGGNRPILFPRYTASSADVLSIELSDLSRNDIIDINEYGLLNKALKHSLTYLILRMKVEKVLVDKLKVPVDGSPTLANIIDVGFRKIPNHDMDRIFFMSRKTLLNEFNHFEGNLSIFQPAIDISDTALLDERQKIIQKLDEIPTLS